jgi:2-keto-3-deoxy-L-rhamnonate aldolase RhmA
LTIKNVALDRLREDKIVVGLNARHSRTSEAPAIFRDCGFHFLFLDDEHSPLPSGAAYEMNLAAIRVGITPLMRVRRNEAPDIACHFSNGALGVIVPHVDNREQAERAARACRFPPRGELSVPGYLPQLGYTGIPAHEATHRLNELHLVVAMIESAEAIDKVDEIAAVDGIDVVFIGLHDTTHALGLQGQYAHPRITEAIDRVCTAARRHGKAAGIGGVKENAMWQRCVEQGMRFLLIENDLHMLVARATERARWFNGLKPS